MGKWQKEIFWKIQVSPRSALANLRGLVFRVAIVTFSICLLASFSYVLASDSESLRIPVRSLPKEINPIEVSGVGSALIYGQLFDNLYEYSSNNSLKSKLVKTHSISSDGKRIKITLDTSILFSDGTRLSSIEVKNSLLEILRTLRRETRWAFGELEDFDKIVAEKEISKFPGLSILSNSEIEFKFSQPFPDFLQVLAAPYFSIFKKIGNRKIGTGSYEVLNVSKDTVVLKLTSKEHYNLKSPKKLVFKLVIDQKDEMELLEKNELDIAQTFSNTEPSSFDDFTEIKFEYLQAMILMLNLRSSIFREKAKRCDFGSSFHLALKESSYKWPPLAMGLPLSWDLYSSPKIEEKLNRANASVKVLYSNTLGLLTKEGNQQLISALRKSNYNVKLEARSSSEIKSEMESGKADAALVGFVPDYLDPDALLAPIIGTGEQFNFSSFSDRAADELMQQSRASLDRKTKLNIYRKLFSLISEECPVTFLGTLKVNYLVSKSWVFPRLSALGFQTLKFVDVGRAEIDLGKI